MNCSKVGLEIWLLFAISSVTLFLLEIRTRAFQAWIRERRTRWFVRNLPDSFFGDRGVWAMRALGIIPLLMWIAAVSGVYCFFHGPG